MNRSLLKGQAKSLISSAVPKPAIAALFFVIAVIILSSVSSMLIGAPLSDFIEEYMPNIVEFNITDGTYTYNENFDLEDPDQTQELFNALMRAMPSPTARFLNLLISIVTSVLTFGFIIFTLNTVMGAKSSYWNLLDGFPMILRIIWLKILKAVFIFLWALLFVIPGIIAVYRYRQADYLLVQHPEMSAIDCINESKRLMKGHKWELFVLDLSFLGWAILIFFAGIIGAAFGIDFLGVNWLGMAICVWFYPFQYLSYALYYKELSYVPEQDEWTPEF